MFNFDEMYEDRVLIFSVIGATLFHILLSAVSALSKVPVNEIGLISITMGILCILAVITTSRYRPFIGPLVAVIIIYLPGAFIGALVKVVLLYGIAAIVAAPFVYVIEVLVTVFPWFFI